MSWKKILVLKDKFSYRQKVGMLLVAGVVCGLSGLFMYLLRAHTYFGLCICSGRILILLATIRRHASTATS